MVFILSPGDDSSKNAAKSRASAVLAASRSISPSLTLASQPIAKSRPLAAASLVNGLISCIRSISGSNVGGRLKIKPSKFWLSLSLVPINKRNRQIDKLHLRRVSINGCLIDVDSVKVLLSRFADEQSIEKA